MTPGHERTTPLASPLWNAGVVAFTLLLVAGAAYVGVLQEEHANPRRVLLHQFWPAVRVNEHVEEAIRLLGSADRVREAWELVSQAGDANPCAPSVRQEASYTCVREYTWYSWQDTRSGASYSAYVDVNGVVRKKKDGWTFRLITW